MPDDGINVVYRTGIMQEGPAAKIGADVPEWNGRHLWTYAAVWRVENPASEHQNFDVENMITIVGPGCFYCEKTWRPTIGSKCPGDPDAN